MRSIPDAHQVTSYVYGISPATGSTVSSNDVLAETRYPDPVTGVASASERYTYTSNALGERTTFTDRACTSHTYTNDVTGRQKADAITAIGTAVNSGVLRIESAYDVLGRVNSVTSYNASTGGSAFNEGTRTYNAFGQMTGEWQSHTGLVNTTTTPRVEYAYSEGVDGSHSRLTGITYPAGSTVNYAYTGIDSALSRPTSLTGSAAGTSAAVTLETFKYLGAGTVIERSRPEVNVTLSMVNLSGTAGAVGDKYTGLDRFGRVVDQRWTQGTAATSPVVDRLTYTYDRNGNRLTRTNALAAAFSERYSYDALNQLQSFARTGGTTKTQQWQFDALGNWTSVTTNSVEQKRTANAQNEVTKVGGKSLAYSATGNVATDDQGRTLAYDGWNRLAAVQTSDGTEIARYEYDGLNRRIVEQVGSPTFAAPVRDVYYSEDWQVLEERVRGASYLYNTRFIWSPVYVDAMIARDSWSGGRLVSGSTDRLDQRVYALQDDNWNTTAIVAAAGVTNVAAGSVISRFAYTPYGQAETFTASWTALAAGASPATFWAHHFQGLESNSVTGLAYARNRDYSATLGRFIQLDPIGFQAGDNNWYRFVANGPTGKVDPSGLDVTRRSSVDGYTVNYAVAQGSPSIVANVFGISLYPGRWGQPSDRTSGAISWRHGAEVTVKLEGGNVCNTIVAGDMGSVNAGQIRASVRLPAGDYEILWNWEVNASGTAPSGVATVTAPSGTVGAGTAVLEESRLVPGFQAAGTAKTTLAVASGQQRKEAIIADYDPTLSRTASSGSAGKPASSSVTGRITILQIKKKCS